MVYNFFSTWVGQTLLSSDAFKWFCFQHFLVILWIYPQSSRRRTFAFVATSNNGVAYRQLPLLGWLQTWIMFHVNSSTCSSALLIYFCYFRPSHIQESKTKAWTQVREARWGQHTGAGGSTRSTHRCRRLQSWRAVNCSPLQRPLVTES